MNVKEDVLFNNKVILSILLVILAINLIYAVIKLIRDKKAQLAKRIIISNFIKRSLCGVLELLSFIAF